MSYLTRFKKYYSSNNFNGWIVFFCLLYIVLVLKYINFQNFDNNLLFGFYSFAVSGYLLSRFALAFYHSPDKKFDFNYLPTITFGIPSKNEGDNIYKTIMKIVCSDYPKANMNVIAINDGSTDHTLKEMYRAQKDAAKIGVRVKVVDWKINRGKREGMAECIKLSDREIIIFIDSDSFVERNTARELVKYFTNSKIGAVAGHALVANEDENILTKMQAVQYFVSFKTFKAAESLFGNVTCCSGCCAAYRRSYILDLLPTFTNQYFWGVKCTYGDDRSLTNLILKKGLETVFSPTAISYTIVPNTVKSFMKQRLRWKKSWTRECWNAAKFMWRKNPIMSFSFYLSFLLPLISPFIIIHSLIWYPLAKSEFPFAYILGLVIINVIYGIYYFIFTKNKSWAAGGLALLVFTFIMIWQLPYAIATLRDSRWGTR